MILFADQLPDNSFISTNIAIIGGGMAGICLAGYLAEKGVEVAIIESGGIEPNDKVQDLYAGKARLSTWDGGSRKMDEYLLSSRLRRYGGSGNHWDGLCAPLDISDFMNRAWVEHSGWPFGPEKMLPYYKQACRYLELPEPASDLLLPKVPGKEFLQINDEKNIISRPYYFTRFSGKDKNGSYDEIKHETAEHPRIKIYLNASVTAIRLSSNRQTTTKLQVKCLNGKEHSVEAANYVLATGGIENARLLMLSEEIMSSNKNLAFNTGRYFQGHVAIHDGTNGAIWISPEVMKAKKYHAGHSDLQKYRVWYLNGTTYDAQKESESTVISLATGNVYRAIKSEPEGLIRLAQNIINKATGWEKIHLHETGFSLEQTPNPESRVLLDYGNKDALGLPSTSLDWKFRKTDYDGFRKGLGLLIREMGVYHAGRIRWTDQSRGRHPMSEFLLPDRSHHIGTTRMSEDASNGVVNPDCRVHGIKNLFVAGSSVFPTSGTANPTLTILALAFRLGEHIYNKRAR